MSKRVADVAIEDIEKALQPEPRPSLFQRTLLDAAADIGRALRRMFPLRTWLAALPTYDDTPHTWPEEIRFR